MASWRSEGYSGTCCEKGRRTAINIVEGGIGWEEGCLRNGRARVSCDLPSKPYRTCMDIELVCNHTVVNS